MSAKVINHGQTFHPIDQNGVNQEYLNKHSWGCVTYPDKRITYINGMLTNFDQLHVTVNKISIYHGLAKVYYVHHDTKGFKKDVQEALELSLQMKNEATNELIKLWRELLADMGGPANPNAEINHYAHSRGGIVTANALEKLETNERQKIKVTLYGSPASIQNDTCKEVSQKISSYDPIPWINPRRFLNALFCCSIDVQILLSELDSPMIDHEILGKTYATSLSTDGEKFHNDAPLSAIIK